VALPLTDIQPEDTRGRAFRQYTYYEWTPPRRPVDRLYLQASLYHNENCHLADRSPKNAWPVPLTFPPVETLSLSYQ
jgi:hypothetical protein